MWLYCVLSRFLGLGNELSFYKMRTRRWRHFSQELESALWGRLPPGWGLNVDPTFKSESRSNGPGSTDSESQMPVSSAGEDPLAPHSHSRVGFSNQSSL